MASLRTFANVAEQPTPSTGITSSTGGFTLVELLVTLVIASIVIVTVPPLFINSVSGAEVRSAAHRLSTALRTTRSIAISRKQDAALLLDLEHRRYQITSGAKKIQLDKDIALTLTTAESETTDKTRGSIRFFPDGSSTGGQIKIAGEKQTYTLDVDWLTGRVSLHD